ncbi:MAG: bis(5'-nucleosyl)-tetraphosphatase (symmetrical) YqeK [Eubacteriales bacterium]|nr:bis(5'-nucleosyl)-tetraphosphatase (symmetrical) YqeK [Eubacteriales bacterium]
MNEKIVKMQKKVKKYLDEDRYQHTMGVMYTAGALAMCHKVNIDKALIAGLLHDCAKCISADKKIKICKKNNIPISEVEYENPGLLHAKLGAFYAESKYHITDSEILCAIRCHTTGRPAMSALDKIIYIADYIEPGRAALPNLEAVRELAFRDLDACICRILKDSLAYLESKNIPLDPMTERTYQYYQELEDE